eukprot:CAMPEP_0175221764 /NCGR_PEP_ID=MMETSP0093-20121207/20472_1 /TAXON_ID=311494 /ORGANISM="Alexandrium monilatum, Strain CCMP3105" /LENGTH=589 /DNA_ID=CAMNT_0016515321 /DNA_START=46 /DNA_END=1812 /DNA_ORIENTATION=-
MKPYLPGVFNEEDLPFARSRREYRDFQRFDKAIKDAQSTEKEQLTKNINLAAQIAAGLSSSDAIKHVVNRLCLVSKDAQTRKETAVYAADSIMRHVAVSDEVLLVRYEKQIAVHLRNLFKRALQQSHTRLPLAAKFLNKILPKWKEKGWFAKDLDSIIDAVQRSAPGVSKPDAMAKSRGQVNRFGDAEPVLPLVETGDLGGGDADADAAAEAAPEPAAGGAPRLGFGATAKAGSPATPAQPDFLTAPKTPRGFRIPSTPLPGQLEVSAAVLRIIPGTPRPPEVSTIPRTPRPDAGPAPSTPAGPHPDGMPAPSTPAGAAPFTPAAAAAPFTPRPPSAQPFTPRGPGPATPGNVQPFTPRGPVPGTPGGVVQPFTPAIVQPFTPGAQPFTPAPGMAPGTPGIGAPGTPGFLPFQGGEAAPLTPALPGLRPGAGAPGTPRTAAPSTPGFVPFRGGEAAPVTPAFLGSRQASSPPRLPGPGQADQGGLQASSPTRLPGPGQADEGKQPSTVSGAPASAEGERGHEKTGGEAAATQTGDAVAVVDSGTGRAAEEGGGPEASASASAPAGTAGPPGATGPEPAAGADAPGAVGG